MNSITQSPSRIPNGIRYYFGREARLRRAISDAAMSVLEGWSYEEIVTPMVDYYSLFERGMGRHEAERAFKFADADGQLLALRPDVTSAIARAAATLMSERPRPLRVSYAAPVFRLVTESPAEWRRELTQIGAELIGKNSSTADLEVLLILNEILTRLGLNSDFTITLNDLEIFNGIAEGLSLDEAAREEMRQLIDTRNASDLKRFLLPRAPADEVRVFVELVTLAGKQEVFARAFEVITNARSRKALEHLQELWRTIESLGLAETFEIDLGDLSKLDYYTGLVFKVYVAGAGMRVGSGGRYDRLTANFGKSEPAIGFVLDLDALADKLLGATSTFAADDEKPPSRMSDVDSRTLFTKALRRRANGDKIMIGGKEST